MLPRWEQIFVILGVITMIWGVVLYFCLAEYVQRASSKPFR